MGILDRLKRKSRQSVADDAAPIDEKHVPVAETGDDRIITSEIALDVVADSLYRSAWPYGWFDGAVVEPDAWTDEIITGVSILSNDNIARSCPSSHPGFAAFEQAVTSLNARVAVKIRCKAVDVTMAAIIEPRPELFELHVDANTRIQVLGAVEDLATARKNQYAAFIREERVLVVWADRVDSVVPAARALEEALIAFLWAKETAASPSMVSLPTVSRGASSADLVAPSSPPLTNIAEKVETAPEDPEEAIALAHRRARPVALISAIVSGLAAASGLCLMGLGIRALVVQLFYDANYIHLVLVITLPFLYLMAAFPCSVVISGLFAILGPIAHYNRNSAFYSAEPPVRANSTAALLPITVQMPVYKEELDEVIAPTIESLKRAITTFERQGGSVNVIVCDDGLQLLPITERDRRIRYYKNNNLAYVARPPHGQDGFLRRGRFKKAGNLNYTNRLSLVVEDLIQEMKPAQMASLGITEDEWCEADEALLYRLALEQAVEQDEGRTWAEGNVRIGEVILLIDSDTRVPEDCFMDASLEMTETPQVAIIQHTSGVMQVANHFFENGMAFFTTLLQVNISMSSASGNVAPFVGHNAFLRWSALQECAEIDDYDGEKRVWSERHVSEDFQVALNLQTAGWQTRWAKYSNNQFQEGVSLTCADELSRWQKYGWGCSEIIFNPIVQWPRRGPLTKLFLRFLWAPISPQAKWGVLGYLFSYYAIALAWFVTVLNFALVGVLAFEDAFYVSSWKVFFTCLLIFFGLSTVSTIVTHYRLKIPGAGALALQQIKWLPFFFIFFGGISFPIAQALICHLLSINMSWTSTSKTVQKSNFFYQVPKILKRFWPQIIMAICMLTGMAIATTTIVPKGYRADGQIEAIIPLTFTWVAHLVWPFVLDPYFTTFTF